MLAEAVDLEFLLTDSEAEALLLENNWIKRRRPRFNVLLRDDKT
jgi:excinuclease ABC subunit C